MSNLCLLCSEKKTRLHLDSGEKYWNLTFECSSVLRYHYILSFNVTIS